ncbi:hypothetical protein Hypma_007331 [Hypsizygus marmoreus]|uniref:Uncharacterized protein n=1 Tax=Hypsizygus marmoreus TaxID=39966 RepID=A0A151V6T1_HYPMA|nr:hypothetical protein Hypma_003416 [Hypsizygus marmoreus]RDB30229.1 hypothetical protein Hypma_007331 [Hypsizygus marmoreus]
MVDISQSQTRLSEELLLLQELGFSDIYVHDFPAVFRYRNSGDSDTDSDLRLLEVITAYLTTGNPGDVVAAAFDKREQICLVLAKSLTIGSADYVATRAFLLALRNADTWIDLYPFLATHCKRNVDKRVRKLNESITDLFDDLQLAATEYRFYDIENQFPRSRGYRRIKYPDEPPTPQRFLRDLMHICVAQSATFELQNNEASLIQYMELFGAADALRRCSFLRHLTYESHDGECSVLKGRVERLKRRLDKVCQYARTAALIRLVKRLPSVPFRWVEDTLVGTGEGSLEICRNPMEVVERVLDQHPLSAEQTEALLRHYPDLCKNWEQRSRFVNTHVHPELRIILDLCRPLLSGPHPPPGHVAPLPIGCSKRSCLCCIVWIDLFNDTAGMKCVTGGTNGRPCDDWALPGAAGEMKQVSNWRYFDKSVVNGIHRRLDILIGSLTRTEEGETHISENGGFPEGSPADWWLAAA